MALLGFVIAAPLLLGGCTRFGPRCGLTIAAIPSGAGAVVGQRLPSGAVILGIPADFKPKYAYWGDDASGQPIITVQMTPEATVLTANYTADHVGEPLAIVIDKTIFTMTTIEAPITDGVVTITPQTPEQAAALPGLFEGCASRPTGAPPYSMTP